jgi:amidohydrolase
MPQISPDVAAHRDALVEMRRDLHRHPELSWKESRTASRVAAFLEGSGLEVRTGLGGTGVLARARGGSGPTVLLRVDMDALPLEERNDVSYASSVPGVMHACGHDGHTAMGALAARVLAGRRLPGELRMLFQPAEEGHNGAQTMVAEGVLDGVDLVLGVHLWNELPVGTLGVKAGPLMAAVDGIAITVRGRGGHGGKPHSAADPVLAAAHVVTALQSVVSREVAPVDAAVVTIGSIHGGHAFNVIPETVELVGTIRTFDPALRRSMPERIARIAGGIAGAFRCRAELTLTAGNPAVVNDPAATEIARRAAVQVVGEEKVVPPVPTMGGEDMAVYFEKAPGCFVFVGSANPAKGLDAEHHNPHFDFDEDALVIGCEFLVQGAELALRG